MKRFVRFLDTCCLENIIILLFYSAFLISLTGYVYSWYIGQNDFQKFQVDAYNSYVYKQFEFLKLHNDGFKSEFMKYVDKERAYFKHIKYEQQILDIRDGVAFENLKKRLSYRNEMLEQSKKVKDKLKDIEKKWDEIDKLISDLP